MFFYTRMQRAIMQHILTDLEKKMVFLVGPRQVGKTWLAKKIAGSYQHPLYLNYDQFADREVIRECSWLPQTDLLILDELHKMPEWKNYLKGLYDTKTEQLRILVTGSARLDTYKHAGDSLVGRFFVHHLLPFSPKEVEGKDFSLDHFLERGGFPEPFLAEGETDAQRWRNQYTEGLIQRDVLDFENIHKFQDLKMLLRLLQQRIGSPLSVQSLSEDLQISAVTVEKYLKIFEALYIIFRVSPFSKNIARSLKKSSKFYFFDTGMVEGDEGKRLENLVAVCLKKHVLAQNDLLGKKQGLFYLRTKEWREVDFCLADEERVFQGIEVKRGEKSLSPSLKYFCEKYHFPGVQIGQYTTREKYLTEQISLQNAENFLKGLFA